MQRLVKRIAVYSLLLCVLVTGLFFAIFDLKPQVKNSAAASAEDFVSLANLSKTLILKRNNRASDIELTILPNEIKSLDRIIESQVQGLKSNTKTRTGTATLQLSYPLNRFWLNLSIVKDDGLGALPDKLKIGSISLPKSLSDAVISRAAHHYTGQELSSLHLDKVHFSFSQSSAALKLDSASFNELSTSKLLGTLSLLNQSNAVINSETLSHYRNQFIQYSSAINRAGKKHSIAGYLAQISDIPPASNNLSTTEHTQQSILALSTLVGVPIYNKLLGIPASDSSKIAFTLEKRGDLAKHFLISAGIRILSNTNTSFFVGAAKELMDSRPHGSGFSFKDLAADKAGIALVDRLSKSERSLLSIRSESDFFPDISDLREGLSEAEFATLYQSTSDMRYTALVKEIEKRIAATPFHSD